MNYEAEISRLMSEYGLSFTHNPGGGEIYRKDIEDTCQLGMHDMEKDYHRLVGWLRKHDAEDLDTVLEATCK